MVEQHTDKLLQRDNSIPGVATSVNPEISNKEPIDRKKVFDEAALEGDNGVEQILVDNYEEQLVDITVVNDDGQYEVAAPRDR